MSSMRISIATVMALVALVALEAACVRAAGGVGVDACRLLTVAALVWATISARRREGRAAAFWFGFALAGWASFVLVIDALGDRGSNSSVISWVPLRLLEPTFRRSQLSNNWASHLRIMDQFRILHYVMVLPVAYLGGIGGWFLARRREHKRMEASEPSAPADPSDRGGFR